jgi:hypothetical protein
MEAFVHLIQGGRFFVCLRSIYSLDCTNNSRFA